MRAGAIFVGVAAGVLARAGLAEEAQPKSYVYGQIVPAYLSFDDGVGTTSALVDDYNSTGRVGFWSDWQLSGADRLKFNFETAWGMRESNSVSQTEMPPFLDWTASDIRKLELIYASGWGSLSAGQGSMATDTVAEIDHSGTDVAGYSDYEAVAGGFAFRLADGTLSDVVLKSVFTNLEGTRRWRVRYDTPEAGGVSAAIAYGTDIFEPKGSGNYADAALRYHAETATYLVSAGIGYALETVDGVDSESVMGSASVLHKPSGLTFTLAAGSQMAGGQYVYAKAGWIGDLIAAGKTAVAVEYYGSQDLGLVDGSGRSWGLVATQGLGQGVDAYLGLRRYQITQVGADYLPASSVMVGARWQF